MKKMNASEKVAGKGKEVKSKADIKFEKKLQKVTAEFNKKVLGMNFDDFKKAFLETNEETYQVLLEMVTWTGEQRDMLAEVLGKRLKQIDANLKIVDENIQILNRRLRDLEEFTTVMAIKFKEALQRKPMTFEERKGLAACVSIKWDKEDEKAMWPTF